jgi:FAD/FMN-containing dehydrogenase
MGGGLGHGALFFGSARYGTAADNTLGLEVATTDGTLLRTGQRGVTRLRPDRPDLSLHRSP